MTNHFFAPELENVDRIFIGLTRRGYLPDSERIKKLIEGNFW